jgi:hypothetical protein
MKLHGITTKCYRWCFAAIILAAPAMTLQAKWLAIHNDFIIYDTDGKSIQVRSGCLAKFDNTYYWYGCDAAMTNQTCYSSTDLLHWKNHGNMLTASRGTNRMDVLYNDSTKKYVMVLKWETPGSEWCNRGSATSTSPTGPFTKLFDSTVYGANTGDMSIFKDDDGKAYYCWEIWDNGNKSQALALMTWDYINLEKKIQSWNASDREANCIMKRRGKYYYLTSLMAGIDPSLTKYWTAPSITGPWTTNLVSVILPGDAANDSWSTQVDFVFAFKGTKDTVQMYDGDRWKQTETNRQGGYVWLPITFSSKDSVIINYYQDWEVEPDQGLWRALDRKRDLAFNKTATASSTSGSNAANNVTDASTYQNYMSTKWTSASSDPQWISIDLGSPVPVNRVILKWDSDYGKAFKIQVSTDNTAWTDVFSTTNAGQRCITDETFATTTARYVRMNGTQRGTSGGYSMFEFMVLNDSGVNVSTLNPGKSLNASEALLTCKNNTIRYRVPSGNAIKLDVVDCRGKSVAVLVDGFKHAGDHEAVVPGTLGRGMYVIRLTIGVKKSVMMQVKL